MAFSSSAIGFYLQMEDQMTPQFPGAISAYKKFVNAMEKLNQRAFDSSSGMLGNLGQLVKGLQGLSSDSALKVNLQLTAKSKKGFSALISDAVSMALASTKIRLRAAMPAKLSKLFSKDSGLRTLYSHMPQPPDMIGGIQKFARGGRVPDNAGTPGRDSVLSLLTPGEVVIPTDLVAKLEDAFETVQSRKGVIEAGFGTRQDMVFYENSLTEISKAMEALAVATKNSGIEAKTQLTPQVISLRERFADLTKKEEKASEEADHFLGRILGPARFIAIQTSLRGLQDGFSQLSGGLQQAAGEVGAGEFQSFPDRLREIRQRLGLSAQEAVKFTGAIATGSEEIGTNFFKALEGTDALIEKGIKNQQQLIALSPVLARANRVTGADFESLAGAVFHYTSELGGSVDGFNGLTLSIDKMSKSAKLAVNTPALMEALNTALNNPLLKKEGPEAITNFANNLLGLRAAADSVLEGDSGLEKLFGDAFAGINPEENFAKIAKLTMGQIKNFDQLREVMTSKGGLVGLFEDIGTRFDNQSPEALAGIADSLGIDASLLRRFSDFSKAQRAAADLAVPFTESATAGAKLTESMDKMTTAAERMTNTIASFVGSSGPMQMMVEFLDQVPVIAILAASHLGGTLLSSVVKLGKGAFGAFSGLFGIAGRLGGSIFGSVASAGAAGGGGLTGAMGGAGATGLMASAGQIAVVLGAVGAALLLIGGYADDLMPILEATLPGLIKLGKYVAVEVGSGISDTLIALAGIFAPIGSLAPTFASAGLGLGASVLFMTALAPAAVELAALGVGAMVADGFGKILDLFGASSPMDLLRTQGQSIVNTLTGLSSIFAPVYSMSSSFVSAAAGLSSAIVFMTALGAASLGMAALGTGAVIAEGISGLLSLFGAKSPMQALRDQSASVVDTLLVLSSDMQRLAPIGDRIAKLQPGIESSAQFMGLLKPMLDQAANLGDAAGRLGDGWFTSGPLSNLRTQAEPMVDTITELSIWFTRVPTNAKALAGVDYTRTFFAKLALAVGSMQQVGDVDMAKIQKVAGVITGMQMTQPSAAAAISTDQIDQVLQLVVKSGESSPIHKDLQETNDLLRQLIAAVSSSATTDSAASLPTRVNAPTGRVLGDMLRAVSEFKQ